MIRINLIYDPQALEREKVKQDGLFALILLLLLGMGISYMWIGQNNKIAEVNGKIAAEKAVKKKLAAIDKKIKNLQKTEKGVAKIVTAINELHTLQKGATPILDELNTLLSEEVWLSSVRQTATSLDIVGFSFTNPGVAKFMKNLEQGTFYSKVELKGISKTNLGGEFVNKFKLNITLRSYEDPELEKRRKTKESKEGSGFKNPFLEAKDKLKSRAEEKAAAKNKEIDSKLQGR